MSKKRSLVPTSPEEALLDSLVDRMAAVDKDMLTQEQRVDLIEVNANLIRFYLNLRDGEEPRPEDLESVEEKIRALEEAMRGA